MTLPHIPGPSPRKMPCSYPGCGAEGLLVHEMCERHRDAHRARNRKWKRALVRMKRAQLGWWQ
jgi:hypothetical protein